MFLLNKIKVKLGDVESVDRKFLYAYENNEFQKGIILLMRYLSNDTKLNKFLYGSINKETILSVLKNYYIKHESLESENPGFFNRVLGLYDKLANIKIYFSENYENKKEIKEQIKSGTFNPGDDEFLREYEQLYFVINDLSHNNSWGYNFLEIMSFETEFENLHEAIWKEMVKDL